MMDHLFSWKGSNLPPKAGRLLVSEPFLDDLFFKRSVVLLTDHQTDGSFGVILNKPSGLKFHEVVEGFPKLKAPIYLGGPVNTGSLFFIHRFGEKISGSQPIIPGLYWGGNINDVITLLGSEKNISRNIKFFLGYSGWVERQLDGELKRQSWVITDTRTEEVMNTPHKTMWTKIVKSLGKEYEIWTRFPTNPQLN